MRHAGLTLMLAALALPAAAQESDFDRVRSQMTPQSAVAEIEARAPQTEPPAAPIPTSDLSAVQDFDDLARATRQALGGWTAPAQLLEPDPSEGAFAEMFAPVAGGEQPEAMVLDKTLPCPPKTHAVVAPHTQETRQ